MFVHILSFLYLSHHSVDVKIGKATVYYPGDKFCGKYKADGTEFKKEDNHVAHRNIKLGRRGVICNIRTKKCTSTTVRDRGPWGAIRSCVKGEETPPVHLFNGKKFKAKKIIWNGKCHWWQTQIKLNNGWKRRGEFDLTRIVAKGIGHRAFDKVVFLYRRKRRKK